MKQNLCASCKQPLGPLEQPALGNQPGMCNDCLKERNPLGSLTPREQDQLVKAFRIFDQFRRERKDA